MPPKIPTGPKVELHDAKGEMQVAQTERKAPPLRKRAPGTGPGPMLPSIIRREAPPSNLPKPGKHTAALEAQGLVRPLKATPEVATPDEAYYAKKKSTGLRLQRLRGGYRVTIDTYEGDAHVNQKVYDKLTAFGARERIALHMASFWAVID